MSKFYLVNTTTVSGQKYFAGDEIDDTIDPKADIEAAGGICWPRADAVVAAQAANVQKLRANKAIDETTCNSLMTSAAVSQMKAFSRANTQLNWYVDPQNASASDENTGTSSSPLKTVAEAIRRLRTIGASDYVINLLSATDASDSFDTSIILDGSEALNTSLGASITIVGQLTALTTGVTQATGTQGTDPTAGANGQQAQLNGGFAWASYVGKIVQMTSGALAGYQAIVLADLGSDVAVMSNWWLPGASPNPPTVNGTFANAGNAAGTCPQAGDTFTVYDATQWNGSARHAGTPVRCEVHYKNIQFTSTARFALEGATVQAVSCQFFTALVAATPPARLNFNATMRAYGCIISPPGGRTIHFDCRIRLIGGAMLNTSLSVFNTGHAELLNTTFYGGPSDGIIKVGHTYTAFGADTSPVGGQLSIFNGTLGVGMFGTTSIAFLAARGALVSIDAQLFGSGNTVGYDAREGSKTFIRTGFTPKLGGTTELQVEGAATAIPPLTAGAAVPAASALTTWAQWAAAPFSGNVMNYTTGTSINTVELPTI